MPVAVPTAHARSSPHGDNQTMAIQLTPERIATMLLEFAISKLQAGASPSAIEQELLRQGAQPDVAKLLVSRAVEAIKPG
ncbi:MAG: hypothetical protein H7838_01170 [Magnetococcus sp. DMHC-8]